jgi:hypothetical protein
MHNWEYSPKVARTQLVRLLARFDAPVSMGEFEEFEEYIKLLTILNLLLSLGKPPLETC